ncbi:MULTISPECIES: glycosyltransferase family 2 protein [Pseudomonas]|uniref:glycosyltransferase family 2 protein n=1 Tax=Pseudomonas nitroreducens TaxID=46680 RepID=UPI001479AE64|nr:MULTISPECIES: glycosyltransferase family A protein [Pseudomonas]NNN23772.1 glycosyltransferase family 2 protein [Pseudomonas nitroreducens]
MHSVDIIVPTYNYGRFLGRCLDSILAQTYTDFGVLVIDNASEDNTQALMADYCQRDARIRYVRNATNIGPSHSVLKAYEMTTARYWVMLCADDCWQPAFLEACVQRGLLEHPECGFAYSNASRLLGEQVIEHTGIALPRLETGVHAILPYLCLSNWIFPSFCVIDRERFDRVGGVRRSLETFNRAYSLRKGSMGDHYLVARMAARHPAFVVSDRLGIYRVHDNSDTASMGNSLIEEVALLYDVIYFDNDLFPDAARYLAKINQTGRILTSAGLARTAFNYVRNPRTATLLGDARRDILRWLIECVPRMPLDLPDAELTGEGTLDKRKNLARLKELVDLPYDQWAQQYF